MSEDFVIVSDPEICGGKPIAKGTRVAVQYLLELSDMGFTAEQIHEEYPTVSTELVGKVINHLRNNRMLKIKH